MNKRLLLPILILISALAACNLPLISPPADITPTPESGPTTTATFPGWLEVTPEVTPTLPAATPTSAPDLPPESIMILEPGPGSRLASPIRVSGEADPTFEQSLVVALLLDDGTQLAIQPVQIGADIGQRGPFDAEIAFTVTEERQGFLQVYATSARDGGVTHLSSVGVILLPSGASEVVRLTPYPERIHIALPAPGAIVRGGTVRVEGLAIAGFEQTLLVELLDEDGQVLHARSITLEAGEFGVHAPFQVDLPYSVAASTAGRVVMRDISPAFGGNAHVSSVEIRLEP